MPHALCAMRGLTMSKGIFITGTDTGVGKTYVARGLTTALRLQGVNVGVMKPAETGCALRKGRLMPSDALKLMRAAEVSDPLSLVNPYRFRKPLAPSVAAEMARKRIDPEEILDAYQQLSQRHEFMIVEGAGGIMVPLFERYTYLDLAQAMRLPVVIVARAGLGTINHSLLTVSVLKQRGFTVEGIVINYSDGRKRGLAEKSSPSVIERLSDVRILGTVTYGMRDFDDIARSVCLF